MMKLASSSNGLSKRRLAAHGAIWLICSAIALPARAEDLHGPLRVLRDNPRYFTDESGKAIFLTGSHTWGSLQDYGPSNPPEVFEYSKYLDFLAKNNHNFMRMWAWEGPRATDAPGSVDNFYAFPMVYQRPGLGTAHDGRLKFDVSKFSEAYFDRLRTRVAAAGDRGIYVSVMLFQGWSVWNYITGRQAWTYHPFQRDNNINGIDGDSNGNGEGEEVHHLKIPAITRMQEAYVRKVVDTLNDLDNVLFEISNESVPSEASRDWEYHMVRFIHRYEAGKPKQHPVGVTSNSRVDSDVLDSSPSEWVSLRRAPRPNTKDTDEPLAADPPAADGRKVSILDTDHIGLYKVTDPDFTRAWVWKTLVRGHNPIWMEMHQTDPMEDMSPQREAARKAMGFALSFARRMDLARMIPRDDMASSRYCLANPGREYLIYLPTGGEVAVDVTAASAPLTVEWFNPRTGVSSKAERLQGGGRRSLKAPFDDDAVLYLVIAKGTE